MLKLISTFFLLAASVGFAADWGTVKQYPGIGLAFPVFRQAKSNPLPPPEARASLITGEAGNLHRQDLFSPYALWYAEECCARWTDPEGDSLVIGKMTHRFTEDPDSQVTRESFATSRYANRANGRRPGDVANWVAAFSGLTLDEPVRIKINGFQLSSVLCFHCPDSPTTLVYAFSPRVSESEPVWYAVVFNSAAASDPAALRSDFVEQFILRLRVPGRFDAKAGETAEKIELPRRFALPADQPNHPVRVEARKSIENYSDWWIYESEGCVILSDLDVTTGKSFIEKLQTELGTLRKAFRLAVAPLTTDQDIALIRVFRDRTEYLTYVGNSYSWSAGLWMPQRRELVTYNAESTASLLATLRHESFHQYLTSAFCQLEAPPWFNEGHATLFEGADVKAGAVTIDGSDRYETVLLDNLETAVAMLPDFLQMSYEDFQSGTSDELLLKYALAWGTVYFLQKSAQQERNPPFKFLISDYGETVAADRDYLKAMAKVASGLDAEKFRTAFADFWTKRQGGPVLFKP